MKRDYKNKFQEFTKIVQGICGGNSSNGNGKNGSNGKITQKLDQMW